MCIGSYQAEGRNTTFIMGHALLKKAILHLKRANGRFILQGTVILFGNICDYSIQTAAHKLFQGSNSESEKENCVRKVQDNR